MKLFILIAISLLNFQANAHDMSKTESYKQAYEELPDGTSQYIGKCSTHQDYENTYFQVTKTLVAIERELVTSTLEHIKLDSFNDVDDLEIEKIKSLKFKKLDLYRLNIGVGGGNGMYLIFNRVIQNKKIEYQLMSDIFDGDVEYCDNKIWL